MPGIYYLVAISKHWQSCWMPVFYTKVYHHGILNIYMYMWLLFFSVSLLPPTPRPVLLVYRGQNDASGFFNAKCSTINHQGKEESTSEAFSEAISLFALYSKIFLQTLVEIIFRYNHFFQSFGTPKSKVAICPCYL